jgi:hypothetical protein
MFIFGIFLGALIIVTWSSWERITEINIYKRQLEVGSLLENVAIKIDTVWLEGEGFSTSLELPEFISGNNYTINITDNYVYVRYMDYDYTKPVITKNVTGNFSIGNTNYLYNNGNYISISG